MTISYKRIVNEYKIYYNNDEKVKGFNYKIIVVDNGENILKSEIKFEYNNKTHIVDIFYNKSYPFSPPTKIKLNNKDLNNHYKNIMGKNMDILKNCLCCESLLCPNNWVTNKTIKNIMEEIIKVINYNNLKIQRILLKKICNKYTNESMDYLHYYLIHTI